MSIDRFAEPLAGRTIRIGNLITDIRGQLAGARGAILVGTLTAAILLGAAVLLHLWRDIPFRGLMQDPAAWVGAPAYVGAISHVGVLIWIAAATACLFAASIIARAGAEREQLRFLAWSGLGTLYLGIDDLMLLHEDVLPAWTGLSQELVIASYLLTYGAYLVRFQRSLLQADYALLLIALTFLGASVLQDILLPHGDVQTFFEDAAKLIGIIFWLLFYTRTAAVAVNARLRPPEPTETALYRTLSGDGVAPDLAPSAIAVATDVTLTIHEDLAGVADDWRNLETEADCTAFQAFAWHAAWQTHIGDAAGVRPAIVVGRRRGRILFIVPLAVEPGRFVSRLVWHASDLCDYNEPLLGREFSKAYGRDAFLALFAEIRRLIAARPGLAFEAIALTKMPETVGGQPNPFMALATTPNPSGAYATGLAADWDSFYTGKRSSSTRQRNRSKRKRLAGLGEVRFVTAEKPGEVSDTLEVLMAQKSAAFAGMGVPDLFEKPGQRAFFHAIASNTATRGFVHVSRLDIGDTHAAINLGLVFGGAYYHVLASYDNGEASRFGPGAAHLQELIAYAIRLGCHTFDFTIGDEGYKREWSDRMLVLHDYRSAATAKGWVETLPAEALASAKRVAKQTPFLWRAVSKVRAMIGTLESRGRNAPPIEPARSFLRHQSVRSCSTTGAASR